MTKMTDFGGKNITHSNGSVATFQSVVGECLSVPMDIDRGKDAQYFYKIFRLGQKIHEAEFVDLSIEELAIIKERVTQSAHLNTVKGRIYDLLEGAQTLEQVKA